jgi:predicted AAA+ superfamily ATPase
MGPVLFTIIRVCVNEDRRLGKFLILGSASQNLIRRSSETLAGRILFLELSPFTYDELLNASKLGQALGVSHPTVSKYLDIMEQTFMVRVLPPLMVNIKKRLSKTPKVYLRDTGRLHALLEIENIEDLLGHPISGASWEGWCIEQILAVMPDWRARFYRTSSGEEIDLIIERGRNRLAFEFNASMSPKLSRGFAGTVKVLRPDHVWIVAPVSEPYPRSPGVTVANIKTVLQDLADRS